MNTELFMPIDDIELELLGRKKKFYKNSPYEWDTFIKVYDEYFIPYVEQDDIIEVIFDLNEEYKYDIIGVKMNNTIPEDENGW